MTFKPLLASGLLSLMAGFLAPPAVAGAAGEALLADLRAALRSQPAQVEHVRALNAELFERDDESALAALEALYFERGQAHALSAARGQASLFEPMRDHPESRLVQGLAESYLTGGYRHQREHPRYPAVFSEMLSIAASHLDEEVFLRQASRIYRGEPDEASRSSHMVKVLIVHALVRSCTDGAFATLDGLGDDMRVSADTVDHLASCGNDRAVDYLFVTLERCADLIGGEELDAEERASLVPALCEVARLRAVGALVGDLNRDPLIRMVGYRGGPDRGVEHWSTARLRQARSDLRRLYPAPEQKSLVEGLDSTLRELDAILAEREDE